MKIPFERYFISQRTKPVVGLDIGSYSIKFAEVSLENSKPTLINLGSIKTPDNSVSGANITKPELIADAVLKLFQSHQVTTKRVAFSLPAASIFAKRVSMPKASAANLATNIEFEASNYIPHRMDAVYVDYQIIGESGNNVDVLIVAARKELISPYQKILLDLGLEPVIADVESFAACNAFEKLAGDSIKNRSTAVVDIGYRHTTVSILNDGKFILSGEINVGVKNYLNSLIDNLKVTQDQATLLISGIKIPEVDEVLFHENVDRVTDTIGSEIYKQIGFFWTGAVSDQSLEQIYFTGGGSKISNLILDIKSRASIPCEVINFSNKIDIGKDIDPKLLDDLGATLGVAIGLSLRRTSDKEVS